MPTNGQLNRYCNFKIFDVHYSFWMLNDNEKTQMLSCWSYEYISLPLVSNQLQGEVDVDAFIIYSFIDRIDLLQIQLCNLLNKSACCCENVVLQSWQHDQFQSKSASLSELRDNVMVCPCFKLRFQSHLQKSLFLQSRSAERVHWSPTARVFR